MILRHTFKYSLVRVLIEVKEMNQHERTMKIMDAMLEEMDLVIIKAKAQLEYAHKGEYVEDAISGDLMRDR